MHRLIFSLILLSLTCGSYAAEVNNLYHAQLPIDSRDEQKRDQLTPALLKQVIVKVVGNSSVVEKADLTVVLDKATTLVQQYEYHRTNVVQADLTQPDQLVLKQRFDADGVNKAIRDLGLPIWGRVRPDILAWVALQQDGKQTLLGLENSETKLIQPLNEAAEQRGLPILLPLMDLDDLSQVSFDAVWQKDDAVVQAASLRYGADILLLAQVNLDNGNATIEWQALIDGDIKRWQSQGQLPDAFKHGIGELADVLANRFSQTIDTNQAVQRLQMNISDVMDYGDFTRLMTYLRQLDYITDIRVMNLNEQKLDLDIAFNGNLQVLQRTLAVGRMLTEETSFDSNGAKSYRLLP